MSGVETARVEWHRAVRIIRSVHPPIDLFEDVADPADWPLLLAAEQKTNPRLVESVGMLDLVPPGRRVAGPGASLLMAPFTHVSPDRPSRFSDGSFGVLYAGREFETALLETMYHHARFMEATGEPPGWTSQFRELRMDVSATLGELRGYPRGEGVLDPCSYREGQALGARLRREGGDGVVYPSVRNADGECAGLFYPDLAAAPVQAGHFDYHWDGARVDLFRDAVTHEVFRVL